ncbi:hypothetical protein PENTCL1PPCAC_17550, partial [Pristionchus entomophagus]
RNLFIFPAVEGFQESPINLNSSSAIHTSLYDASQFNVYYGQNIIEKIEKIKNHILIQIREIRDVDSDLRASHLDARYRLVQYHGHWNIDTTTRGREHIIDGTFYPAEFHFVHIREDFSTLPEAVGKNGVAVIAVFLQV